MWMCVPYCGEHSRFEKIYIYITNYPTERKKEKHETKPTTTTTKNSADATDEERTSYKHSTG